ncbi:TetR/AcrR family transcriptional regulator [Paractinoplanes rhizophilus]|jgi:AcrR family transcriptional regulator|uniref:TetR/AcrR family transcriptional regulator n=1 Tax=Paractinoplanes rhizophilus TaxID=1416877 RepID=A0ABW2HMR6_9ACTN|nr:helix-turn-helix domain-containing protein [Actinoplanes sp.]
MTATRAPRRDARDNAAKLRKAALEQFLANGLDASLYEIARAAGVSIGTLYNHFGGREGLIDAVVPDVLGARLRELAARVDALATPKQRLETFVRGMIELQSGDPALNDALLRRFPDAVALLDICAVSTDLGRALVRDAHRDGSLSPGFTEDDLLSLLWLAGTASRDPAVPAGWRRVIDRALDSAWTAEPRTAEP